METSATHPCATDISAKFVAETIHGISVRRERVTSTEACVYFSVYPYRRVANDHERALFWFLRDRLSCTVLETFDHWEHLLAEHFDGPYITTWPVYRKRLSDLEQYELTRHTEAQRAASLLKLAPRRLRLRRAVANIHALYQIVRAHF